MSYRNPTQNVDTQSGQYVRQMQQSVAGSFEKLSNKISADNKERARKNEIIIREAEKRSEAAAQSIFQAQSKNSSIDFNGLNEQVNMLNDVYKINPTERTQEQKNFIRNMNNAGTHISGVLQNTSAGQQEYLEKRSIPMGSQGGFSRGNLPENLEALDILYGWSDAPGRKEARYDMSGADGPVVYIDVYNENDKLVGSIINKDMSNIAQPDYVPNLSKQTTTTQKELEDELDLGAITSLAYKNSEPRQFKAEDGTVYYTRLPDKEYIKKQAKVKTDTAIVALSTDEAITFYNNVLSDGEMDMAQRTSWSQERDSDGVLIPDPDLVKIQEKYLDYVVNTNAKFNTSKNFGTTKPKDYKPNDFDKKTSQAAESVSILLGNIQDSIKSENFSKRSLDFGQGTEEVISIDFIQPAKEGGMGEITIVTQNKNKTKAGEVDQVSRTIDLNTKEGMKDYAIAAIIGGSGSSSEKEAKIKQLEKMLNTKKKESSEKDSAKRAQDLISKYKK